MQPYMISPSTGSDAADEWVRLGVEAQGAGKFPDAERHYRHALRLEPAHAVATQNLGVLYAQLGNINEGLLALERASIFDAQLGIVYMNRALMCLEADRIDEALAVAEAGVKRVPCKDTRLALAMILSTAGRPEDALPHYRAIIDEDPTHPYAAMNSCLPYDERVSTTEGLIPIGEIVRRINAEGRAYEAFDSNGVPVQIIAGICNGKRHLARLACDDGSSLRLTYDHVVFIEQEDGSIVEKRAGDVVPGHDRLLRTRGVNLMGGHAKTVLHGIEITDHLAWAAGIMVGDGFADRPQATSDIWEVKVNTAGQRELFEKVMDLHGVTFSTDSFHWGFTIRGYGTTGHRFWEALSLWGRTHAKIIPEWVYRCGSAARWFLAGLYDADGCVHKGGVTLSNTSYDVISGSQLLLRCLGIHSSQTAYAGAIGDDGHARKDHWHLNTNDRESLKQFHATIPLNHEEKAEKLAALTEREVTRTCLVNRKCRTPLIVSRDKASIVQVYDIQTASGHFWAAGHLVHNCFVQTLTAAGPEDLLAQRRRWYEANKFRGAKAPTHRPQGRPIRVGYVSGDFKSHSAAMIFGAVVLNHDRSVVTPYLYSTLPVEPDKDLSTKRFKEAAGENWRDISTLNDEQADELVRKDRIDILVDLAAHTNGGRLSLFTRRPAPIQATAWGFAHGTGVDEIDYFLACPVSVPQDERRHYAEKVVDLPTIVTYMPPPDYKLNGTSAMPFHANGFVTFGSYARYEKLSGPCLEAFGRILSGVPDSRLQLKDHSFRRPYSIRRVLEALGRHGVDPGRVRFSIATSHADHMLSYQQCDLCLDTWPHSGGVVALEVLYMGVPLVTLYGTQPSGRQPSSVLTAMGRTGWIARTREEYVEKAVALAGDVQQLQKARRTLRDELLRSPAVVGYREAVERAYMGMVDSYGK